MRLLFREISMTVRFDRFNPTVAEMEDARKEANIRAPLPDATMPVFVVVGFFGGFTATQFAMSISNVFGFGGLNIDDEAFLIPAIIVGAIFSLIGYLYFRSKEKAHDEVYSRIIKMHEERRR